MYRIDLGVLSNKSVLSVLPPTKSRHMDLMREDSRSTLPFDLISGPAHPETHWGR
jgi:hypothetical protein